MTMPRVCIIDYGMGNLGSVRAALRFLGNDAAISDQADAVRAADAVVLPGVGAFGEAMANLRALGLDGVLTEEVAEKGKPFLGICLGMQLIGRGSHEKGYHEGLGWIGADVVPLEQASTARVPHVGWSETHFEPGNALFRNIDARACFYFDHSFAILEADTDEVATSETGCSFVAALRKGNVIATQFHPEKSQRAGLKLLRNFLDIAAGGSTLPGANTRDTECRKSA